MRKVVASAAATAVVVGLSWAGWSAWQRHNCDGLEEDYLNSLSYMRSTALNQSLGAPTKGSAEAYELFLKVHSDKLAHTLRRIFDECGPRAGESALRKGRGSHP